MDHPRQRGPEVAGLMLGRRVVANVVFFAAAFVLMSVWAVNNIITIDAIDRPYPISARFENAFGVLENAEVTYRGVAYGRVTGVERVPGGVEVAMDIDRGRRIPREAGAMISRKSAIGEPYVDLTPPEGYDGEGPYMEAGTQIPQERTAVPLEFSELLRSAGALIESIPPEDLQTVITELADGLEGRTQSLRDLATSSDQLAATFAARTEALDRLLANNTRLIAALAAERGSLGRSLRDLALIADSLERSTPAIVDVLDEGSQLMHQLSVLVAANKANLDCDLKILEGVIELSTTEQRLAGLRATLDLGPEAFSLFWDTRDVEADGPWIRVGTINNSSDPPAQYVPPKDLPPPRGATPCQSAFAPSGQDYLPGSRIRSAPPPTAAPSALALAVAALVVALQARRHRLGRPQGAR